MHQTSLFPFKVRKPGVAGENFYRGGSQNLHFTIFLKENQEITQNIQN